MKNNHKVYTLINEPNKEGYYVTSITYSVDGTLIPYTTEAIETLEKATNGIRGISEILFTFLSQEPELIASQLSKGNLLGSGNISNKK